MAKYMAAKQPKPIEVDKFLGLNESVGDTEIAVGEAIYMRNFRITRNYKLQKRSGHTTFIDETQPTKAIQGMWYGKFGANMVLIYVCNGNVKQKIMPSGATTTLGTITDALTTMFYFSDKLYFLNGTDFKEYNGTTYQDVDPYIPTVAIGSPPAGGGTLFEEVNLLTGKKKQEFIGNGSATAYQLAETAVTSIDFVWVNDVLKTLTTDYTVNATTGVVTFVAAPASAAVVKIQWTKTTSGNADLVKKNKYACIFGPGNDTTVFLWGNPDQKNRRSFSGTMKANYWPVNNYTLVGSNEYAITDIVPQYDRQVIFKQDQAYYSLPEAAVAPLTGYIYPVYNLNYSIGNVAYNGVQIIRNNPVSLYGKTIWEWVSTQVKNESNAMDKGERMSTTLGTIDLSSALTFDSQTDQELWINVGSAVYIWNYDNNTWYQYDNITASCFLSIGGVVYYGTKDGKIERFDGTLSDNGTAITALWKSGFVDFGAYEYLKTSRDMWFSIQPFTRTSVTIKCPTNRKNETDTSLKTFTKGYRLFDFDDIDFSEFSFETNRNPQPFRIKLKAKKYVFIQFILSNAEVDEPLVFLGFKVGSEVGSLSK